MGGGAAMERPRDIKEGGASPGKVPRQAYGEGPGRKRSGPPSMNLMLRYIRAGRSCDSGRARLSTRRLSFTPAPLR